MYEHNTGSDTSKHNHFGNYICFYSAVTLRGVKASLIIGVYCSNCQITDELFSTLHKFHV